MKNTAIEIVGWFGVVLIVSSYGLNSIGAVSPDSLLYILMNLFGSIAIVIDAIKDHNSQPAILNIIWAVIAFINLVS